MKPAEEWADIMIGDINGNLVLARQIQADALRYAASLSGELHRVHLLALAEELETPGYSVPKPKP